MKTDGQLQLFPDHQQDRVQQLLQALIENGDRINQLYELSQKVLRGEPGYASPEYIKKVRRHRRQLRATIGSAVIKVCVKKQSLR